MPQSLRLDHPHRRFGGLAGGLLICLVLVGVVGAIGYQFIYSGGEGVDEGELITAQVMRGPFDHIVLEQGEIESSSNTELLCEVKSRGYSGVPILWVIDEGTKVTEGEKLVELDASTIEQELKTARIQLTNAEADVASGEALVEQAKIAREEYLEGVFMTEKAEIESRIAVAEQDLLQSRLLLDSSARLVAKGVQSSLQMDAEKFKLKNAENVLSVEHGKLRVLEKLTKKKMLVGFDSDIEAAEAKLSAYKLSLEEAKQELEDVDQQLENCVIYAPSDGIVVHANRYSSRGGNAEFVVEPGASVRERQAIIRLPDPTQMQVKVKVNESRITLIEEGMPVKIAVDALDVRNKPGVVVLLTDGRESCRRDPCVLASQLAAEKNVTVHVIGFKVRAQYFQWNGQGARHGRTTARCLADKTGGKYVSTESTEELVAALRETLSCPMTATRSKRDPYPFPG